MRYFIIACIFVFICSLGVKAQNLSTGTKETYYKLIIGEGVGGAGSMIESGICVTAAFEVQRQRSLYALAWHGLTAYNIIVFSNVRPVIKSFDLTYGRLLYSNRSFYAGISAGASIVSGTKRGALLSNEYNYLFVYNTYEKKEFNNIGFPISAQLFYIPARFAGIGVELYTNINSAQSFYAVNFCAQFGKLRPKKNN